MAIQPRNTTDIKVDNISEKTVGVGVTTEGVLLIDGSVRLANNTYLKARNAANDGNVDILKVNSSDQLELSADSITADIITEKTNAAGVTVDSVLIKDGGLRLANNTYLKARNDANNADINLVKLNASNILEFASGLLADTPIEIGTWSPTYSTFGGTGFTFTGVTTYIASYWKIGKLIFFSIRALGTTGGSVAGSALLFTLPFSGAIADQEMYATTFELAGFGKPGRCTLTTSQASVNLVGGAAWQLGAVTGFGFNGFYFLS